MNNAAQQVPFLKQDRPDWLEDQETEHPGEQLHNVYTSGKYSDLTISCQGRTFKAHKLVLSARSKVFAAMIDGGFKEGTSSHIDLPDDDPTMIELLLQFIYRNDYYVHDKNDFSIVDGQANIDHWLTNDTKDDTNDVYNGDENTQRPLLSCKGHAEMYRLGDKYDIPALMNDAATYYFQHLVDMRMLSLSRWANRYVEFLESIPTVYNTPSKANGNDLRTLAAKVMTYCVTDFELCAQISPMLNELREQVFRETPEFAIDVAIRLMKKPTPVCYACWNEGHESHGFNLARVDCTACRSPDTAICRISGGTEG